MPAMRFLLFMVEVIGCCEYRTSKLESNACANEVARTDRSASSCTRGWTCRCVCGRGFPSANPRQSYCAWRCAGGGIPGLASYSGTSLAPFPLRGLDRRSLEENYHGLSHAADDWVRIGVDHVGGRVYSGRGEGDKSHRN